MTEQLKIEEISNHYFNSFSKKDLKELSSMFSEDVVLRDWDIEAKGKEDVLAANANIFNNVESIEVEVLNLYIDNLTVAAEITININSGAEILLVLDILEFDSEFKISAIRAYKGN
jgi:ketosteroid isomerase-like protein